MFGVLGDHARSLPRVARRSLSLSSPTHLRWVPDWNHIEAAFHEHAAYHWLFHSQAKIGHEVAVGPGYGFYEGDPPLRPLVKVHPVTGRKALYIGRHAYGIPGLDPDDSENLLNELMTFSCQPPRTYMHD